jgi:hypothetical protein
VLLVAGAVMMTVMHHRTELLYLNVELWGVLALWAVVAVSGGMLLLKPHRTARGGAAVALVAGLVSAPVMTYVFVGDLVLPRLGVEGHLDRKAAGSDGFLLVVDGKSYTATGDAFARVAPGERVTLLLGAGTGTVFDAQPVDRSGLRAPSGEIQIGAWTVRAHKRDGRLQNCSMSALTDIGVTLGFAKAPDHFAIIARVPAWAPPAGVEFDVTVSAGGASRRIQASPAPGGLVGIPLHGDRGFEQSLRSAELLVLQSSDRTFRMKLPPGRIEAFATLNDCASSEGRF